MLGKVKGDRGRGLTPSSVGQRGAGKIGGWIARRLIWIVLHHSKATWQIRAWCRKYRGIHTAASTHKKVPLLFAGTVHPFSNAGALGEAVTADQRFYVHLKSTAAASAIVGVIGAVGVAWGGVGLRQYPRGAGYDANYTPYHPRCLEFDTAQEMCHSSTTFSRRCRVELIN